MFEKGLHIVSGVCGTVLPGAVGKNASELSGWLAVYESVGRFPCRLLWEISVEEWA